MGDVAYDTESVTCLDCFGAEWGEPLVRHRAGLKVADVVRRVVHELRVPDATLVRLLEPFELRLGEVEPFDVHHDGRLPRSVRRFKIGSSEGEASPWFATISSTQARRSRWCL
jgi:hypothetical protein